MSDWIERLLLARWWRHPLIWAWERKHGEATLVNMSRNRLARRRRRRNACEWCGSKEHTTP